MGYVSYRKFLQLLFQARFCFWWFKTLLEIHFDAAEPVIKVLTLLIQERGKVVLQSALFGIKQVADTCVLSFQVRELWSEAPYLILEDRHAMLLLEDLLLDLLSTGQTTVIATSAGSCHPTLTGS